MTGPLVILLFGKNGQVGCAPRRSLSVRGDVAALDRRDPNHGGDLGDRHLRTRPTRWRSNCIS